MTSPTTTTLPDLPLPRIPPLPEGARVITRAVAATTTSAPAQAEATQVVAPVALAPTIPAVVPPASTPVQAAGVVETFDKRHFHIVAYGLTNDEIGELCKAMKEEYNFLYNDYIEDMDKYSSDVIGWPQGSNSCCARDLAMNRVYGVYTRKASE